MDFGIALPTAADSWRVTKEAEELGFTHAWFYDTQMLSADCFVAMGAAAVNTRRIRLGTGVLVPSNRIAPVAANALATLNQLAPGRIDFGVGTGFTARRAMGFGAIKVKDMETYIHQVYGLLRRETVEFEMEGQKKKIRFLNPELPLFNTKDPIALHLSAFGPRTQALTARFKAGWINFVGNVEGRDLLNTKADVFVCEGFTGNVILKLAESIYDIVQHRNIDDEHFNRFNFEQYGGVPVLGVSRPVIIGHGISHATAFKNMIRIAHRMLETDLMGKIKESFVG